MEADGHGGVPIKVYLENQVQTGFGLQAAACQTLLDDGKGGWGLCNVDGRHDVLEPSWRCCKEE
jgi:hypothetical protein